MKFKEASGAGDSKNYLRLKDKESSKGLLVGEPYDFKSHWVGNKTVLCSEDNLCANCAQGFKPGFRFRVNFIVKEGEGYVAKVFEQGWTVYQALSQLNQVYDLEKTLVQISRFGSGQNDTTYSILPVPKGEVGPDLAKKLAAVPLHDLKHKDEPQRVESKGTGKVDANFVPEPAFDSDESIPF